MRIGFRAPSATTVAGRKGAAAEGCTRSSLARGWCEREDGRNAKGALCLAAARKRWPELASSLGIVLPELRPHVLHPDIVERDDPDGSRTGSPEDLGEITVEPGGDGEDQHQAPVEDERPGIPGAMHAPPAPGCDPGSLRRGTVAAAVWCSVRPVGIRRRATTSSAGPGERGTPTSARRSTMIVSRSFLRSMGRDGRPMLARARSGGGPRTGTSSTGCGRFWPTALWGPSPSARATGRQAGSVVQREPRVDRPGPPVRACGVPCGCSP